MKLKNIHHAIVPTIKTLTPWLLGLLLIVSLYQLIMPELKTFIFNNQAVELVAAGKAKLARQEFFKAAGLNNSLTYIPKSNLAALDYTNKKYDKSVFSWQAILSDRCEGNKKSKYCDVVAYNLGNALYRKGESLYNSSNLTGASSTDAIKEKTKNRVLELWQKAIAAYQADLSYNADDKEAEENIDFIMKKIKELESLEKQDKQSDKRKQNQKKSSGKNDKQNEQNNGGKNNGADQAKNGDKKTGNDGKNQDGKKDGNVAKVGADKEGDKNDTASGGQPNKGNQAQSGDTQRKLSQSASRQVDEYMRQLEQKNRSLENYFRRNGEAPRESANPNDPFSDPFFQQFFRGTPFESQFKSQSENSLEKDW